MKTTIETLTRDYRAAFLRYLARHDEAPLHAAYNLGRQSLGGGFSLPDLVQIHHAILLESLGDAPSSAEMGLVASRGAEFLAEVLAPFEMSHRRGHEKRADESATQKHE